MTSHHSDHGTAKTEIKRFVAPTMARALKLVSEEMGPEAVILSSQRTAEGVEVITSIEPDLPTNGVGERRSFSQKFDEESDTPMQSDSAWKKQDEIRRAAAQYQTRQAPAPRSTAASSRSSSSSFSSSMSSSAHRSPSATKSGARDNKQHLAQEFERAHEKMIAAKKQEQYSEQPRESQIASPVDEFDPFAQEPIQRSEASPHRTEASPQRKQYSSHRTNAQHNLHAVPTDQDEQTLTSLKQELADMRLLLEQQLWHMSDAKQQASAPSQVNLPASYSVVGEHLKRLGLNQSIIEPLLQAQPHNLRPTQAWKASLATLSKKMPIYNNDIVQSGGVFAFVGPTGVGKTTTIAKIAAQYVMQNGPGKVAILTTDNYRVGAQDQLKNLGRILDVPVKTIDDLESLPILLSSLKQFPLVLIDTAGFRQGDPLLKRQLNALDACPTVKRMLVMACNSHHQTMRSSTHGYAGARGIDACVLSKLDESFSMGEAISVLIEKAVPLAYITDGQEIPADLSKANGASLIAKAVAMTKASTQTLNEQTFNQSNNVAFI